jgi:hypothetical protein
LTYAADTLADPTDTLKRWAKQRSRPTTQRTKHASLIEDQQQQCQNDQSDHQRK